MRSWLKSQEHVESEFIPLGRQRMPVDDLPNIYGAEQKRSLVGFCAYKALFRRFGSAF
jgi:hypothetical protein